MKFFLFLLITQKITPNAIVHTLGGALGVKPDYFCIDGLVKNYGLTGNKFPLNVSGAFPMCPMISKSCCTSSD